MKILAVDTSTMLSSIAVIEDGKIIGDFNVNQEKTHSESLVPMIEYLLKLLGIHISEIDLYAIGKGPGSFTGIRIGMTVIKTLAQVYNKKVIPISTLEALNYNVYSNDYVISMIDARGNRIYASCFKGYEKNEVIEENLYTIDEFSRISNEIKGKKILVGEISRKYMEFFDDATICYDSISYSLAKSIAYLAYNRLDNAIDCFSVLPNYMRKSQAEREYEKNATR